MSSQGANNRESRVMVLAALDTKAAEAVFICEILRRLGRTPLLVDIGVLGEAACEPDISSDDVLRRGGATRAELLAGGDRARVVDTLAAGAEVLARELHREGALSAVLALGGSGGTTVGTAAMRQLPLGVPKVMVSTIASGEVQRYVGMKDICMLHSVVDFSGVNAISEPILRNACGAVAGMLAAQDLRRLEPPREARPLIAASMFGVTTALIDKAQKLLAQEGYELVPFHATGIGGRTMETLIDEGVFVGVLDLTTTEWADEVVGGTLTAGPTRLEAAARAGIPQVVAPGALDIVNFVGPAGLPEAFRERTHHRHNDSVVLLRTTAAECAEIGRRIAEKLSASRGPVTFLFPRLGISALDRAGAPFFDPAANEALLGALRAHLSPAITLKVLEAHINDDAFAEACCRDLLAHLTPRSTHA